MVHQSSYQRERGEFGLCQGQVHLVNYCKVEDYNSGNITGAYCDMRLYHTSNTRVIFNTREYY